MKQLKVLLAQLNSNGDCLYATVIARQIKEVDHPGCHLTWAVNKQSLPSIQNNPYIDTTWIHPTEKAITNPAEWKKFVSLAEQQKADGAFDVIYYTQVIGNNLVRLDGRIRPSLYRNYPRSITVPYIPLIFLYDEEIKRVKKFAEENKLSDFERVILVECGPESFQLSFNRRSAQAFAARMAEKYPGTAFILSSGQPIESPSPQVIDGSVLSFRENAELTKYCDLMIGCGSGITWLSLSSWAKRLPRINIINDDAMFNTSVAEDQAYCGLETTDIIEVKEGEQLMNTLDACFTMLSDESFSQARATFHTRFQRRNFLYLHWVAKSAFDQWNFTLPVKRFREATREYGFSWSAVWHVLNAYLRLPYYIPRNLIRLLRK